MNQTHKSGRNTHSACAGQACYETEEPFLAAYPTPIYQLGLNAEPPKKNSQRAAGPLLTAQ